MRKLMSFVIAGVILFGSICFSAGDAAAAGTITYTGARFVWGKGVVFVFEASGFRNRDVKDASLTIGGVSFDLHCVVNKKAGKIICVAGSGLTQYAGETGIATVAGHSFYVTIPHRSPAPLSSGTLSCPAGLQPGADVTFFLPLDGPWTTFVNGSSLAEVQQNADAIALANDASIIGIGSLYCGQ